MNQLKYCDLFAGTGAFSLVLRENGCKCVFANDMASDSKKIYEENFGELKLGDINTIDVKSIPEHNILCGGFPCQPFSIAGERKGFKDTRSNVFWKILEIISHCKPDIVILENVKNLLTHDKGNTMEKIKTEMIKINYTVKYSVFDTCKVTNIPQHRERVYIICFKNRKDADKFSFDKIHEHKDNMNNISFYLEENIHEKYFYTPKLKVYDKVKGSVVKPISQNTVYQLRRHYIRESKRNICPTLLASMGTGGHNVPIILVEKGIRKLTPRECFNLQGFPKDFRFPENLSDTSLYKLAGNAVSVPVIRKIIKHLFLCVSR